MKEVIPQILEVQRQLEQIEKRISGLETLDIISLQEAELLLTKAQNQVVRMENLVLKKRLEFMRTQIAVLTDKIVLEVPNA